MIVLFSHIECTTTSNLIKTIARHQKSLLGGQVYPLKYPLPVAWHIPYFLPIFCFPKVAKKNRFNEMGILTTISREQCCFTSLIISFRIVSRFHTMFAQLVRKRSPNYPIFSRCVPRMFPTVPPCLPHLSPQFDPFFLLRCSPHFPQMSLRFPSFSLDFTLIFYDFPSFP